MSGATYGYAKTLARPSIEDAVELVTAALLAEGFDVVSEMDLGVAFQQELGLDFRRYLILSACNASLAHKALACDPQVGLLLLCYVVIQESQEDDRVVVSIADPTCLLHMGNDPMVDSLAQEVDLCIRRVIRSLN